MEVDGGNDEVDAVLDNVSLGTSTISNFARESNRDRTN